VFRHWSMCATSGRDGEECTYRSMHSLHIDFGDMRLTTSDGRLVLMSRSSGAKALATSQTYCSIISNVTKVILTPLYSMIASMVYLKCVYIPRYATTKYTLRYSVIKMQYQSSTMSRLYAISQPSRLHPNTTIRPSCPPQTPAL
jgi:hypothetical protein